MAIELKAEPRTKMGRAVTGLRKTGMIPGELYGHGIKNEHVSVSVKELRSVLKRAGETSIVDLMIGTAKHPVFIHDVMRDPVSDEIIAADFYQVRLDEKIKIKVPLVLVGEAPGVKEKGGILVSSLKELEVEGLPMDIPHTIEVDIAAMNDIGASISVAMLSVPATVRVTVKPEFVVATITARMTEEQEAALAAKGADVAEVKTEGEEKKAALEAAATAEGAEGAPAAAGKPAAAPEKK